VDGRIVFVRSAHQVSYNASSQREKSAQTLPLMGSVCAARHAPKIRSCTEPAPPRVSVSCYERSDLRRLAPAVSSAFCSVLVDLGKVARRHEEKRRSDREVGESAAPAMQLTYRKHTSGVACSMQL
jgi:hypothetical protein